MAFFETAFLMQAARFFSNFKFAHSNDSYMRCGFMNLIWLLIFTNYRVEPRNICRTLAQTSNVLDKTSDDLEKADDICWSFLQNKS